MPKPRQFTSYWWLFLLPIPLLWCLAAAFGLLDFLENRLLDWRFAARGELPAPLRVVYVDMDSESVTDLGREPWDRAFYAEVCEALLNEGGAKAIGVDVVFSEKGQPELLDTQRFAEGNVRLARLLFDGPPIVLAAGYAASEDRDINGRRIARQLPRVNAKSGSEPALPPELPEFRAGDTVFNPPHVGLIDTFDGATRWVPVFARVGELTYHHMAVELARLYWGLPADQIRIGPEAFELRSRDGATRARIPLHRGQDVEVNWFSRWSSAEHNPRASFVDVLLYARQLQSDAEEERSAAREFFSQFKGSVVLIGPVDPLMQDVAPTPLDPQPVPRVGIHGNLLKTIVSGLYLKRLGTTGQVLCVLALTAAVAGLAAGTGRSRVGSRIGAGLLLVGYGVAGFLVFSRHHFVLPLAAPIGAAFTTSFAAVAWRLVREEKQKGRIKSMFGTYVSPELVDRMVESGEDPKLGGAEVQITAYFSDIQDFSTFSEKLTPTQVVELMNEYLTCCTDIITVEGGTLDKYIGDAVVAMFGAPLELADHAYRGCLAAVRVQQRLEQLKRKWASDGGRWPASVLHMRTRVGLNSGAAVVGNMGSQTRFNYTMMGDTVNLAARLESAAKTYGAGTLVTETTKRACELRDASFLFRYLDRIVVKGRTQPVAIYELIGLASDVSAGQRASVERFEEGLALYHGQDWDRARSAFLAAAELEPGGPDAPGHSPARVYAGRCEYLKAHRPAGDWDGVWVMHTK